MNSYTWKLLNALLHSFKDLMKNTISTGLQLAIINELLGLDPDWF